MTTTDKHFSPEDYDLPTGSKKTISVDGNKIIRFFFQQASTDPISTRRISMSSGKRGWLDDCRTILDVGAGSGATVKELLDEHKIAMGVTVNPKEIIIAKKEFDVHLELADMHDLPYGDNSFDGLIMWDVLEHSVSPFIALSEAKRVLKKNGKILIFMPSEEDWTECVYHYSVMNDTQMSFMFRRLGFKVNKMEDGIYEAQKIEDFDQADFDKKHFK